MTKLMTEKIYKEIKKYFQTQKQVLAVYLYGSFAHGSETSASDVDLGIILLKPISDFRAFDLRIKYASDLGMEAKRETEVIIINNSNNPLLNQQIIAGKLIYSKDEDLRAIAEVKYLNEFEDTRYLRQVQNDYLFQRIGSNQFGVLPKMRG